MTRIENNPIQQVEKVEVIKKKKKAIFSCGNCLFLLLIILLVFVIYGLICVARTGYYDIPVFSKIFYSEPEPQRYIVVSSFSEKEIMDKINQLFFSRDQSITLSEKEISYLLQGVLDEKNIEYEIAQLAVNEQDSEMFVQMIKPYDLTLTVYFNAVKTEGQDLEIDIDQVYVGNYKIPGIIKSSAESLVNEKINEIIDQSVPQQLNVGQVTTQDKKVKVSF